MRNLYLEILEQIGNMRSDTRDTLHILNSLNRLGGIRHHLSIINLRDTNDDPFIAPIYNVVHDIISQEIKNNNYGTYRRQSIGSIHES